MKKVLLGAMLLLLLGCASAPPEVRIYLPSGHETPHAYKSYVNEDLGIQAQIRLVSRSESSKESFISTYHKLDRLELIPIEGIRGVTLEVIIRNPKGHRFVLRKVLQIESPEGVAKMLPSCEDEVYEGEDKLKMWQLEGPILHKRSVIMGARICVNGEELPTFDMGDALYEVR